jgi:hypothetical protein
MDHHPEATDTADDDDGSTGFEAWTALQKATDQTRANLIADIVGHPQKAPSVKELDYMNPALGEDAIRRHLGVLQDVGVVAELDRNPISIGRPVVLFQRCLHDR